MTVVLEPMTAERYVGWNKQLIVSFADEKVKAGNWPAEGAVERAAAENAKELPDGIDSVGHDIFVGTVDGEEIGFLWLHTNPAETETYIYDIEVREEHRGKGYGRGLLEAGERWCAERKIGTLKLHVFGFNTTAIKLYETSGFEVTNLNMAKRILPL